MKGYFMGYTNSRVIIRWCNPTSNKILQNTFLRLDEEHFVNDENETPQDISKNQYHNKTQSLKQKY